MFCGTQKWQNILPITKLENVEKMHWAHVLKAQMVSIRRMVLIFLVDILSRYLTTLQKFIWGGKHCVKNFWDGFKIQNSLSKVEKKQNILPIPTLENVEKMYWAHLSEAQMVSICRMALIFSSTHSLDIVPHWKNLFGGQKLLQKLFRWL